MLLVGNTLILDIIDCVLNGNQFLGVLVGDFKSCSPGWKIPLRTP